MNVNDFQEQRECIYKDEQYAVRDNGAIYRYAREGKRLRKDDETGHLEKLTHKINIYF